MCVVNRKQQVGTAYRFETITHCIPGQLWLVILLRNRTPADTEEAGVRFESAVACGIRSLHQSSRKRNLL